MHATATGFPKHTPFTCILTVNNLAPCFSISIGSTLTVEHKSQSHLLHLRC